jgi:predicted NBD/HSP70 family sugar kinase
VENDANVGVLGERSRGVARGARDVVYLKLSTGVGAGLLLDGSLYAGCRGIAGDIGHVTVVENGHICGCGNRGCLETVASAGALARALAPTHGDRISLPRLLELVDHDDPVAERAMSDIGRHVGRALAPLCMALDVELVVLGGELGATSRRLLASIRTELRRTALARQPIPVRPASLGDRAEALGALELALGQEHWFHQAGLIALRGAADPAAGIRSSTERRTATG